MKKANNYHPKLDYLFCKYASSRKPLGKTREEEWLRVYRGLTRPSGPAQEKMLRLKAVLDFIKDKSCEFSASTLVGCLAIYLDSLPRQNVDCRILRRIFPSNQDTESLNFIDTFIAIVKEKPFSDSTNIEMAEIAVNFLLIKQGKTPIVFYPAIINRLLELIGQGDIEGTKLLMLNLLQRSEIFGRDHRFARF